MPPVCLQQILAGMLTCRAGGQDCVPPAMRLLDSNDWEVLEASTVLHFVGIFISHKSYHKHSHYLIKVWLVSHVVFPQESS